MMPLRSPVRRETRGRSRALQALYAAEMRGADDLLRVGTQVWDDLGVERDERAVAERLVVLVQRERDTIDRRIADVAANWRLDRLGAIERAVLRLASAELAYMDTPPRVVLQEAIRLAERYGSERSAAFVNGVLDAVARALGRL
ncbi:MAG: transcription antitermination factor NusB [Gemmatimonadaceae bacterium]|jgi:N utilization substance protein B|nr:transcription antitermination factor NusB [Gemmatimonadaceae bacterium]